MSGCRAWFVVCATWSACAALPASAAEVSFPYTAYANAQNVQVRSGPGENYYATAALPQGAAVEVYRHDPGGWYAIRPPQDSFSWVQAEDVVPSNDRLVVVDRPRVPARVGSQLNDQRDVIQVHLERGEQLEVLGVKTFAGASGKTWYKVAPPSGEFRWVYGRFLSREPAPSAVAQAGPPAAGDPSEVELAGLWPKRNKTSGNSAAGEQGFWRQRAPREEEYAAEGPAPEQRGWWQRRTASRNRARDEQAEPWTDEQYDPRYEYSEEPYVVYEDGPPEEGESVYRRGAGGDRGWDTARARLSPELKELADSEARDGDVEEGYDRIIADRPVARGRSHRDREAHDDRDYNEREYDDEYEPRGYDRQPMSRDRRRSGRDRRAEEGLHDDYAYDDRRHDDRADDRGAQGSFKVRLPSRGGPGGESVGELASDLDWLDLELSTLVTEEAAAPDYDELRERAEDLLAKAASPLERGQARLMMEKIDRFAELSERSVSIARRSRDRQSSSRTARRTSPDSRDGAMIGTPDLRAKAGRYDGVGKLTAVVSERAGSPSFALLDERGKVQCYVTPAPGVNLRHYVGQEVGLNGSVGFNAELSRRQVVAQRITPLDDGLMRR